MKHLLVLFALALVLVTQFSTAQTAYITNAFDNTVSVINVATNAVIDTINAGAQPQGVAVSPDGSTVYITNGADNTVSVINTATNAVTATITGVYAAPAVCVSHSGDIVYVANYAHGSVSVIDANTNTVYDSIIVDSPFGLCVSPDGSTLYVANNDFSTVSIVNTSFDQVSSTVDVGTNPYGIVMTPDGSKVYVSNYYSGTVSVIATATNTVSSTINVGTFPQGICVSPDGSRIYVANNGSGTVSVISTIADTVSATVSVGTGPWGVSVTADGSKVCVANSGDNTVNIINTATNTVTDTIKTGNFPEAFGNFISAYSHSPSCGSNFSIAADTTLAHHYIVTDHSYGKLPLKYDWNWGDNTAHDTIPYPVHTYADSGFYTICLSITDSSGCQSTYCDSSFHAMRTTNTMVYISVFDPLTTGTQTINAQSSQVFIYPNPATNTLTIHTSSFHNEAATVSVMNMLGEIVQEEKLKWSNDISINIKNLCAGIYFLQVKSASGSVVKKFVKQ